MRSGNLFYRPLQFWHAVTASPRPADLDLARHHLTPPLMALFLRMQPSEQAHSIKIARQLAHPGAAHPDLLAAALLHDVGKSRCPLRVWERALVVLGRALFPKQVHQWGQGQPRGWRRPFVVAEQHPAWGAEMAAQAGASPLLAALIRRHQEQLAGVSLLETRDKPAFNFTDPDPEDQLLVQLQRFDDAN